MQISEVSLGLSMEAVSTTNQIGNACYNFKICFLKGTNRTENII